MARSGPARDRPPRKGLEVARFEVAHQLGRRAVWILFGLFLFPLIGVTSDGLAKASAAGTAFDAPILVAEIGVILGLVALLVAAAVVGDAATRDVRTRLEPLMHAAPVRPAAYLAGRFLGALAVVGLLMLTVPLAHALAPLAQPEAAAEAVGRFRPAVYLESFLLLVLPNAVVAAALMFGLGTLARHAMAAWLVVPFLFLAAQLTLAYVGEMLGRWDLAMLLDPLGFTVLEVVSQRWTPGELGVRRIGWDGALLANRALWLAVAGAALALAFRRFDFGERASALRGWRWRPWRSARSRPGDAGDAADVPPGRTFTAPVAAPRAPRSFGAAGRVRQTWSVARDALREMTPSWVRLAAPAIVAFQLLMTHEALGRMGAGSPVLPTTGLVLTTLGPGTGDAPPPVILAMVLLPILLAGELVWRERDAEIDALADAAPVPAGVRFLGKLLALWGAIVAFYGLLVLGGVIAQARLGAADLEPGLYLRVLGLRVLVPLAFAAFALSVHEIVNHKHVGHVVALLLVVPLFPQLLGFEHPLLQAGFRPAWHHSDIRGLEPFVEPVLGFSLYWGAWALLFALLAGLFQARGMDRGARGRLRRARRRLDVSYAGAIAAGAGLVLLAGGVIFYNTNVLNRYRTGDELAAARAEYERRYGGFGGAPRPRIARTELDVEIHPTRREADVRGVHHLVNRTDRPLDTLHVATSTEVRTLELELDRPARAGLVDDALGHRVYLLDDALPHGDSLRLAWEVRYAPRGFPARDVPTEVVGNGTFVVMRDWMPLVGYQPGRELTDPAARREHGLAPRPALPALDDEAARFDAYGREHLDLSVTVGTAADQVAVAPGELVRSWREDGRRYFRYETDAPIGNGYAIFSADYAVTEGRWRDVVLEVLHHPEHDANVARMMRGMEASLARLTERFGPYPWGQLRMVEYPSRGGSLHAASGTVWYQELFALFDPGRDRRGIDLPFAVTAHEVAHQFQPVPARVEGAILLSESFAWYAALGVIEAEYGAGHLRRFLDFMRRSYLTPRSRADVPLLRANDAFLGYRKGPFAMYALREYVGQERVDRAWRRLRERHRSHEPPFATALDLYRELRAETPDSLHTLLGDLLERNTFWELRTERATAEPTPDGAWRVELELHARKVAVDTLGGETELPMDDLVEVGVYAPGEDGQAGAAGEGDDEEAEVLHLAMHRIRSGPQTITITVPERPARAGVDSRHLLIDVQPGDNVVDVADISGVADGAGVAAEAAASPPSTASTEPPPTGD